MPLPTDYTDATTPTGATTELPATTSRGVNAITTQINTNTTDIATKVTSGGALGTPSSGTLTNCTGLPISGVTPMPGYLAPVRVYTVGSETFTISAGTVTQIAGTTIQGITVAVGDRIVIGNAPATTGTGSSFGWSTQATNGIYRVTANTTNLTVVRESDMSGTVHPAGLTVFAQNGSSWLGAVQLTVSTPSNNASAFTWGTTTLQFSPSGGLAPTFNGLITAGSGLASYSHVYPGSTNADDLGTSGAYWRHLYITDIEIGGATDTTIARASAGKVSVEGNNVLLGSANSNTATQSQTVVSATAYYVTNSDLAVPANLVVGSKFRWTVAMAKTAAGTGIFEIIIYRGTAASTADTADVAQTIGTQTAAVDNMTVDVEVVVTTTGATGAYYWSIIPTSKAATATGFGVAVGPTGQFSGTKSSVALNTASLKFGLGFRATTGTPTVTVPLVRGNSYL